MAARKKKEIPSEQTLTDKTPTVGAETDCIHADKERPAEDATDTRRNRSHGQDGNRTSPEPETSAEDASDVQDANAKPEADSNAPIISERGTELSAEVSSPTENVKEQGAESPSLAEGEIEQSTESTSLSEDEKERSANGAAADDADKIGGENAASEDAGCDGEALVDNAKPEEFTLPDDALSVPKPEQKTEDPPLAEESNVDRENEKEARGEDVTPPEEPDTAAEKTEPERKSAPLPYPHKDEHSSHDREEINAEKKDKKDGRRLIDGIFDFIELFVFTLVGVLLITSFFIRQSVVDGDSMLGTLRDGDNLIISDFMYDPQPGDIVVCEDYSTALRKPIVKRVIATGGQTVRFTADAVYVDGAELYEPYVFTDVPGYKYDVSIPPNIFRISAEKYKLEYVEYEYYEITVPEGELFVMGDHRNNSTDSRVIGTVTEDSVIGKVLIRFYPFEDFGAVK